MPSKLAVVSIRGVHVDCPYCEAAMWEGASTHDSIPWGTETECWQCHRRVLLTADPFTVWTKRPRQGAGTNPQR